MTIHEIANHLRAVNVGGWYNREKMPSGWIESYLKHIFGDMGATRWIFEIALPDGWWYMSVSKFSNGEYGYFIPETREQEKFLIDELKAKAEGRI